MPMAMLRFRADRPFLFFIEDAKSGLILFMQGRLKSRKNNYSAENPAFTTAAFRLHTFLPERP